MAIRIDRVYTRSGDDGTTGLVGGTRVRKDHPRIAAYGDIDELNSVLGQVRAELEDRGYADNPDARHLDRTLTFIQQELFDLGSELATPDAADRERRGRAAPRVSDAEVEELERWIDRLDTELEPLASFVLPGGARGAALLHLARTVCRRAERRVTALAELEPVGPLPVKYLNRLSDYLFTAARTANRRAGVAEPKWIGRERS